MKSSSPAPAAEVDGRKPRQAGWWYPWLFVGGMAIVIVVNMVMVFVALDTFPGLETDSHYRKGLAYNDNLNAAAAQAARGWQSAVAFEPARRAGAQARTDNYGDGVPGRIGVLVVEMRNKDGHPLRRLDVRAQLVRPTHAGVDRDLALAHAGDGRYRGQVSLPLLGQWDVRVLAGHGAERFQATHRLFVR